MAACRSGAGLPGLCSGLLLLLLGARAEQMEEHLKREHSLTKPYQGVGSSSSSLWELMGNAMVMTQFVRLTPDIQSKQGAVWNRVPCYLRDWEMQVHFKIHGQGKKNLNGDGFAIWYTKDRTQPGPVFGSKDNFLGLGVFVDTYPNEEKQQEAQKKRYSSGNQRVFPYVSTMVSNGSLAYDHDRDGRPTELGGCTAMVRNLNHDTFLVIRYVKRRLTVLLDIDGKHEWRDCVDIPGVHLPRGYYFGVSSVTGDLSDNHDIISLKLYQLTVERTLEEDKRDKEVFLPVVDNMKLPGRAGIAPEILGLERMGRSCRIQDVTVPNVVLLSQSNPRNDPVRSVGLRVEGPMEPMSGLALFLIVFFSLVAIVFAIVIGIIVYNKWQEQSRKHFY